MVLGRLGLTQGALNVAHGTSGAQHHITIRKLIRPLLGIVRIRKEGDVLRQLRICRKGFLVSAGCRFRLTEGGYAEGDIIHYRLIEEGTKPLLDFVLHGHAGQVPLTVSYFHSNQQAPRFGCDMECQFQPLTENLPRCVR